MLDLVKMADKFGGLMLNACLIVFGGVVVKALFGEGTDRDIVFAVIVMGTLFLFGLIFGSITSKKECVK